MKSCQSHLSWKTKPFLFRFLKFIFCCLPLCNFFPTFFRFCVNCLSLSLFILLSSSFLLVFCLSLSLSCTSTPSVFFPSRHLECFCLLHLFIFMYSSFTLPVLRFSLFACLSMHSYSLRITFFAPVFLFYIFFVPFLSLLFFSVVSPVSSYSFQAS